MHNVNILSSKPYILSFYTHTHTCVYALTKDKKQWSC